MGAPTDRPNLPTTPSHSLEVLQGYTHEVYDLMSSRLQQQAPCPLPKAAAPVPPPPIPGPVSKLATAIPPDHPLHDPKYVAMASRIAAYYQQRSQAVANFQHRKCKEWAAFQHQKNREFGKVMLLVVAFYIRDRYKRRQKRASRRFQRGLLTRADGSRVNKNESIRRWATSVPGDAASPKVAMERVFLDRDEENFDMDKETPMSSESELCQVADHLIRGQLNPVDVPVFGPLSFEESDDESDEEMLSDDDDDDEFDDDDMDEDDEGVGMAQDGTPDSSGSIKHEVVGGDRGGRTAGASIKEEVHSDEAQVDVGSASRKQRDAAL